MKMTASTYQIIDPGLEFRGPAPDGGKMKYVDSGIIHHSASSNDTVYSIHEYHKEKKGYWGIGYQFVVDKEGNIYRGRPEEYVGAHAGSSNDYNHHSIGICFIGNYEGDLAKGIAPEIMPEAQLASGRWLIHVYLKGKYGDLKYLRHSDVAATACPGKGFHWDKLMAEYKEPSKYVVCIGEYDTEAEAQAVASVLSKMFNAKVIKQ